MHLRRCGAVRTAVCLLALLAATCVVPRPARADSISSATVHELALQAAQGEPVALARLRMVTAIDGRPSALGALLVGGTPSQVRARVVALSHEGSTPPVSSAAARAQAAAILSQPRYGKATVPNPLADLFKQLSHALGSLASLAPGGPPIFWLIAGAIVVALSLVGARRMLRRLSVSASRSDQAAGLRGEDPAALARDAQAAEARGAFADAVRLRFRAGLLTLGERGAIDYRPSLLTADVARRLRSPRFDSLARTFERVAYGSGDAEPADAAAARDGWADLLSRSDGGR